MADPDQKLRVFISYSRRDCMAFADGLLDGLEAAGFDPFLDRHDIVGGEAWEKRLDNEISQADTVIFVISPESVLSQACDWEITRALARTKRIIPILAMEVDESTIPPGKPQEWFAHLKSLQFIDFNTPHGFGRGLKRLAETLKTDLGWIREHTRLGEIARRWDMGARNADLLLRGAELQAAQAWMQSWNPLSPEPTDLHRALIHESQTAEDQRNSQERARLEEVALLQSEREEDLRKFQKRIKRARLGNIALGAVALGAVAVAGFVWREASFEVALAEYQQSEAKERMVESNRAVIEAKEGADVIDEVEDMPAPDAGDIGAYGEDHAPSRSLSPVEDFGLEEPDIVEPPITVDPAIREAKIAAGWDIDVFYCEGANQAANRQRADDIEAILLSERERQIVEAAGDPRLTSLNLGRIRVRPLREKINALPGYRVKGDETRAEDSEQEQAAKLRSLVATEGGPQLASGRSGSRTAYYLSVFLCAGS